VIEQSLERLGEEYRARGQQALFEELKHCLAGCNEAGYRQIAQELGMDEGAFRQHVHRCKRRFRAAFDATIATTLASDEDLEEERRFVRDVLAPS
jgi:DNA-directed RNA polymerase specialized sigma24 family protein